MDDETLVNILGYSGEKRRRMIEIERIHKDAIIPSYAHDSDAGFDFHSIKDYKIEPGQLVLVRTGLKMAIPDGYEIQIRPRSGLSLKTSLRVANSPGTIDSGYRGEIKVILENTGAGCAEWVKIEKGQRIAQGVLKKAPQANFKEVESLEESERGEGGFGSSGK